ncbi:hypothetical protein MXAN_7172 [Myxococcus xanthus DK 1622]|uniref:Uncharacterized protein n=1 Tax=Myxococcus xanthus (strain DK1622) TaxID=246197 RepID=Q1CWD7_MYXXD|nr:hypothetical protein MXAN_7172 [Myxococcus xanthus DK 1622]
MASALGSDTPVGAAPAPEGVGITAATPRADGGVST